MKSRTLMAGAVSVLLACAPVVLTGSTGAYADPSTAAVETEAAAAVAGGVPSVYTDPSLRAKWAHDLGCTLLEPVRARYLWANGNTVSPAAPPEVKELATLELTYQMPDGTTATTVREPYITGPPKVPLALLRSFVYDARQAAYRNYAKTVPSIVCVGRKPLGSTLAWQGPNYGGAAWHPAGLVGPGGRAEVKPGSSRAIKSPKGA